MLIRGKSSQKHTTEISWWGYGKLSRRSVTWNCSRIFFCSTTMLQLILHRTQSQMLLLRAIKFCLTPCILLTWHPASSNEEIIAWQALPEWRGDFRGHEQSKCRVLQSRSLPSHLSLGKMSCIEGWICRDGLTPPPNCFIVAAWFFQGDI